MQCCRVIACFCAAFCVYTSFPLRASACPLATCLRGIRDYKFRVLKLYRFNCLRSIAPPRPQGDPWHTKVRPPRGLTSKSTSLSVIFQSDPNASRGLQDSVASSSAHSFLGRPGLQAMHHFACRGQLFHEPQERVVELREVVPQSCAYASLKIFCFSSSGSF